jgi:5-(carboxyamino)imidazole ribonucleotide synthase
VSPAADAVAVAQDRIREKQFIASLGIPVAPHIVVRTAADLEQVPPALLPGILKRSRFGYDGKGQARVKTPEEARQAFVAMGAEPCVLEALLPLEREVSVVVVRGFDGATAAYPVAENWHANGILDVSIIPARVPPSLAEEARREALAIAEGLDYRGVLCVEFFVVGDGRLLVNEIAPRPHNSGHYTIDACITSQFEQQARVMARLPLGSTAMHCAAVMVNILGDSWAAGEPDWTKVLAHPRAKLHLYGKKEARPGRKMGHFTMLGDSVPAALAEALEIRAALVPGAEPIPL